MLSDAARINGIKSEGMRAKREGKALVERNNYGTYCMDDVAPIPDYMIKFPPGQFNGLRVHYNIPRPRRGMGSSLSRCLWLWAMQGAAKDAMGPASRQQCTARLHSE